MMDQSGAVLPRNGLAENKLRMGVTSAIGGEGGTPVAAERVAEYFAGLEKTGISINFGSYFSETQARTAVLGNTARAPNAEELVKMQAILETAMQAGAMGMTTALIYPPSSFATTDELVEMAKVAGRYGGIYATHMRDEGKDLITSIKEAIAIGERGGLPVEIFHLKAAYQPGWGTLMHEAGRTIDAARARGVDVAADMYVYMAGGTGLEATIPDLGAGRRPGGAAQAAGGSGDSRAAQERDRHRRCPAGRTSSRPPADGIASCSRTRATRRTRSSTARSSRRSRRNWTRIPPMRRSISSRRARAA